MIEQLLVLINEQINNGNLHHSADQEAILKFTIQQLAYAWQDGREIEILEMFKSSLKQ